MSRYERIPPNRDPPAIGRLRIFDSPITTSANNLALVTASTSGTAAGVLILLAALPGAPRPPEFSFVPFFVLTFPLCLWAVIIQKTLARTEAQRSGRVATTSHSWFALSRGPFEGLPEGFLRAPDWVAMGLGFVVAAYSFLSTPTSTTAPPNRPFLGISFAFTTFATVIALAEHRRRKQHGLHGVLGWPRPPVHAPRLARSRALIAWLLVTGAGLGAISTTVVIIRSNDYQYHEPRLVSNGTTTVTLPDGDDVIFVGNLEEGAQPPFDPSQVTVTSIRTGRGVPTRWDPSNDHNSPDAIASLGLISFSAPASGRYRITVDGPPGIALFVSRSPGAEFRLEAPWIALLVVGLGMLLFGLACLVVRVNWRYRIVGRSEKPRSIEEWMIEGESR